MKYFKFLFTVNKKIYLFIVLISLIISTLLEYTFVASVPYLLNIVFNNKVVLENFFIQVGSKQDLLKYILIIILVVFLLKSIFYFLNQYFYFKYSFDLQNKLSQSLLSKYLNQNYSIFINSQSSEMLKNVKDNTELVRGLMQNCLTFLSEIFVFFCIYYFSKYLFKNAHFYSNTYPCTTIISNYLLFIHIYNYQDLIILRY